MARGDFAEEPVIRTWGRPRSYETFLGVPRALSGGRVLVGEEPLVDGVGDSSFQRSEGFLFGFAFGEFAVVVGRPGVSNRIWVTAAM